MCLSFLQNLSRKVFCCLYKNNKDNNYVTYNSNGIYYNDEFFHGKVYL
jgi:hypothetical protein